MYFVSSDAVYAIGPKTATALKGYAIDEPLEKGEGAPAYLQVEPTELVLNPGQTVKLHARLFDDKGRFLREDTAATWSLTGLKGTVTNGSYTVSSDPTQAGQIVATSGALKGESRARVIHPLPWTETFDELPEGSVPAGWVNGTAGKFTSRDLGWPKSAPEGP